MKAVLIPTADFSISADKEKFCAAYLELQKELPDLEVFYNLPFQPQASDNVFFVIATNSVNSRSFVTAVQEFADRLNFTILKKLQAERLLLPLFLYRFVNWDLNELISFESPDESDAENAAASPVVNASLAASETALPEIRL